MSTDVQELELHRLSNLSSRQIALVGGNGSGKTSALGELHRAPLAVLSFAPARALGDYLEERVPEVHVVDVPEDYGANRELLTWVMQRLLAREKVCLILEDSFADMVAIVDRYIGEARRIGVRDLLLMGDEAQRYVGQNRADSLSVEALNAAEVGRNWRWGRVWATQRPASIHKGVLALCDTLLIGRLQDATDYAAVDARLKMNVPNDLERANLLRETLHYPPGRFLMRAPDDDALPTVNQ